MFSKILVPLDGSRLAEHALELAFSLAQKFSAEVILLRVAIPDDNRVSLPALIPYPRPGPNGALQRACDEAEAYLLGIQLSGAGLPIRRQVVVGTPPELIVATAREQHVDLIVMSTHGRSGFSRLIYGSVAEAVLRGAHVPVLLTPLAVREAAPSVEAILPRDVVRLPL